MDMQYKIPIQVENEDTIILGLSLRQMGIIIVGLILAFGLFNKFDGQVPKTPLAIVCVLIVGVFFLVAKFRTHDMTFLPFLLNLARYKINGNGANGTGRIWTRGVDSYSPLEMGYVRPDQYEEKNKKHTKETSKLAEHVKTL
ncbi:MAG: PrgI family protein [Candidatus Gracilibacteria bacterium]